MNSYFINHRPSSVSDSMSGVSVNLAKCWLALKQYLQRILSPIANPSSNVVENATSGDKIQPPSISVCIGTARPHLLADVLKALIWIIPHERYLQFHLNVYFFFELFLEFIYFVRLDILRAILGTILQI